MNKVKSNKLQTPLGSRPKAIPKAKVSEKHGSEHKPDLKLSRPKTSLSSHQAKPPVNPKSKEPIKEGNPWQYKPNTSKMTADQLVVDYDQDVDDILIDSNDEDDIDLLSGLLKSHSKCSVLFTRRLVNQKLSEAIALLDMDCKSEILRDILQAVVQFLIARPDFLVEQENDGYLVFTELIRSEIFFFLDLLLNQRSKEMADATAYTTKELTGLLAKLEGMREDRDRIFEQVRMVVDSIVPPGR